MTAPLALLLPFPEPEPPFPGSAFSLCHHGPPSRMFRDCEECRRARADRQDRADAWFELTWALWGLGRLFEIVGARL